MSDTTTTVQPAKRGRNGSVVLTDRMCEKRVTKRTKIYDRKCPGLYVSIAPAGAATLSTGDIAHIGPPSDAFSRQTCSLGGGSPHLAAISRHALANSVRSSRSTASALRRTPMS